ARIDSVDATACGGSQLRCQLPDQSQPDDDQVLIDRGAGEPESVQRDSCECRECGLLGRNAVRNRGDESLGNTDDFGVGGVVRSSGRNTLTCRNTDDVGADGDHLSGSAVTKCLTSCRTPPGLVEACAHSLIPDALGCLGAKPRISDRSLRQ